MTGKGARVSRLTIGIYLVALAPVLAIVAVVLIAGSVKPTPTPPRFELDAAHDAATRASTAFAHDDVEKRLAEMLVEIRDEVTVRGPDGKVLGNNTEPPLPPLPYPDQLSDSRELIGPGIPSLIGVALGPPATPGSYLQFRHRRGPREGRGPPHMHRRGGLPPPLVWSVVAGLVVVSVASFVFARSLTRPLRHLAQTANRLGEGDLGARAGLTRKDELGAVGEAFDTMAERLATLVRSQQELLANVSHELRTPLARIRVALDIAAEGDAVAAREALSEITEDLAELEQLVSVVLTSARLDLAAGRTSASGLPLAKERVDVQQVLEKSIARFMSAAPERSLEVDLLAIASRPTHLVGDAVLLRRAFDNLLDNARAYSDSSQPVTLVTRLSDHTLEVDITDRGIGVAPEDLPRLATPFFRTDRSRNRKSGGLGLGLLLSRRIVEAHGGTLRFSSELGRGTTVTISLPLEVVAS